MTDALAVNWLGGSETQRLQEAGPVSNGVKVVAVRGLKVDIFSLSDFHRKAKGDILGTGIGARMLGVLAIRGVCAAEHARDAQ